MVYPPNISTLQKEPSNWNLEMFVADAIVVGQRLYLSSLVYITDLGDIAGLCAKPGVSCRV